MISAVEVSENGELASVHVFWFYGKGMEPGNGGGDGFDRTVDPPKVTYPFLGTPDPDDPTKLLGGGVINKEEITKQYKSRDQSKTFGNPVFEAINNVPGVQSFACVAHLLATVLAAIVGKQKAKEPAKSLFVPEAAHLLKNVLKVCSVLHHGGAPVKQLYNKCRADVRRGGG